MSPSDFAPLAERRDVIRPETDQPLTLSALGTALTGTPGRVMPCSSRVGLAGHGTRRWTLRLGRGLAQGAWKVDLRAIDVSGRSRATTAVTTVRVR